MTRISPRRFLPLALFFVFFAASCASTGPKVTSTDIKNTEADFYGHFFQANQKWLPRVYRVGYKLVSSPVPGHGDDGAEFNFAGVGIDELKEYGRRHYGIPDGVRGVLVLGLYPGSQTEGMDILPGDVITHVNGKKVKNPGSYFKRIRKSEGSSARFSLWRQGKTVERQVPLEKVYYNAQFFIAPTPHFDAHAAFSQVHVGIGALRYAANDDELAVIMGHELGHTTLNHSLKKMGVGVGSAVAYGVVAGVVDAFTFPGLGNLVTSPVNKATDAAVSRRYEREADYYGMLHAFHAGYNVESGSRVFSRLATDSPGFELLAYTFSSHPKSPERFLRLDRIIQDLKTRYPERFEANESRSWEIVVPVGEGETEEQALERFLKNRQAAAEPVTTSETGTATSPSPDKDRPFAYPAPRT